MSKTRLGAVAVAAALALAACAAGDEETKIGEPQEDDGTVAGLLLPSPPQDDAVPEGLDEKLPTAAQAEDGWISAPWALAAAPSKDAVELQIIYVAGDTECYGPAGFTLDESDSKVTVGAYTAKRADAKDCPSQPAGAFKWGTVALGRPLGQRALEHAGVAALYDGFSWAPYAGERAEPASPSPSQASKEAEQ
ncbi:MAG: hypothetical protein LBD90_04515 [Bifidobacteriaceae bacterium]|jgi:hypothetical protein|nr:hypothetical protein [Bifidobacteriaceae bacterium]